MSTATSKPNKVLAKMLDRLFAGLMNGPGMNCRPHASRQRVDLTQLSRLNDATPEEVLRQLLGEDREAKVVAKVKPPKKSELVEPTEAPAEGSDQEAARDVSPQRKAWDDQTALLNKLRLVADDARTYENDTGVHVLNVGFPLLSLPPGTFAAGARNSTKRILAPIAFIPVTLTMKRGTAPTIELCCRGEGVDRVMPNSALLAWLEQQTGKLDVATIFGDDEGNDPWREIRDLVSRVATALGLDVPDDFKIVTPAVPKSAPKDPTTPPPRDSLAPESPAAEPLGSVLPEGSDALHETTDASPATDSSSDTKSIPESFKLIAAPRPDNDGDSPAILTSAVLGLFPVANQGLLRDTQAMLAQTEPLKGPVEAFLTAGIDFDEPPPPPPAATTSAPQSGETQHLPPQQRVTRLFVTERLATSADPCQARAVALARESRGLVVHGPPGTGKSQTITNIIADHLSRGQRVLFVCEKRTALDVVYDRLEHMGLGPLCGIVHDPQRDQRDLYRSIRDQLEALPASKTDASAESRLTRVDGELQKLHEDLTQYHHGLMLPPAAGEPSFSELVGRWLALRDDNTIRIADTNATQTITPGELDAHENELHDVLTRGQSVNFGRNPWSKCAGVALNDFLSRPMETVRTTIQRCIAAAATADATIDPAIPAFSSKTPLNGQGKARAELADRLEPLLQQITGSAVARWADTDAAGLRSVAEKLKSMSSDIQTLHSAPLDTDLRAAANPAPRAATIPQQIRDLDAYLEVAGKWYSVLSFGAKSNATKVLRQYGLPLTPTEAERLKRFLNGVRARLTVQQVRSELSGTGDEASEVLPPDDVLNRFLQHHAELFDILLRLRTDPALEGLAPIAAKALPDRTLAGTFIDGLRKSPARAEALSALEDALQGATLIDAKWLLAFGQKLRGGEPAGEVTAALLEELDTLEGVLRVRDARTALPDDFRPLADDMLAQSAEPAAAVAALRKSVLTGEITRRLRANPTLQAIDAHRIESSFARYRELEAQKKQLVRDAVQHRWVSKQRDRLLAANGARMNSLGASLSRRLLMSGPRAMRLRQVIAVGEQIDGGDPLFDLCPVWMASPETVAQVFPREALFDVIIFDEASQCRLEEALPVLTRGERVVIAGDPKQLPPTRFFESAFTQSEQDEPETEQDLFEIQQADVEDLLGASLNLSIQQCYLDVHYRSRNADLIGFSNVNFYGSRLQAIPGHPRNRSKFSPLTLYRAEGVYDKRGNSIEADRVVQIVYDLLKRGEPPSIGIACFNLQQRDAIVEKLDDRAAEDAEFAKRLSAARQRKGVGSFEGLFVKNLESVQGDERDHIIISTTYGPDSRGKFYRRFGPLGRAGGGRRLNVLVTRARHEVHLVTSIPREAYVNLPAVPEGQSASGAWLLFAYLKYAEDLAAEYAESASASLAVSQTDAAASEKTQAADRVDVHATKSPSIFAKELATTLASGHHVGSAVHWGNEGFCVDLALRHPARPDDVTVGVLCDSCRYAAADDPVEWDIFRTGILTDQGWTLRRIWTPHFFRDPAGHVNAVLKDAAAFVASERPVDALPTAQL